ncbi:MAG TPA: SDR family NAD(P)-dependent oxidoreductase [Prolixibacteraceae bacterium]|nr:SDR family NAD(P)-dependent oxidoreductase [Prolixibacteraceae bacterium]
MSNEYVLITGASRGLGKAIAREYALRGNNLILVSLPDDGLHLIAGQMAEKFGIDVQTHETDLADHDAVYRLARWVNENFSVKCLVNNAGTGGTAVFGECPVEQIDHLIMLNVRAVTLLTRLLLPNLKQQSQACILNIASMASFSPMTFKAVYSASKAYVYYFTRALTAELKNTHVFVSVVHPGPMKTNPDITQNIERQGWFARLCGLLPVEKTAEIILKKLEKGRRFIVPGLMNKFNWIVMRILPIPFQLSMGYKITSKEI